jgi:hypothetical protein
VECLHICRTSNHVDHHREMVKDDFMEARCQTLVITRRERSIRFMSRSAMVFLTNCTAPGMFRSMRILWRHSVTKFFTSRQLSLLTVSIPAFHKLHIHCSEKSTQSCTCLIDYAPNLCLKLWNSGSNVVLAF